MSLIRLSFHSLTCSLLGHLAVPQPASPPPQWLSQAHSPLCASCVHNVRVALAKLHPALPLQGRAALHRDASSGSSSRPPSGPPFLVSCCTTFLSFYRHLPASDLPTTPPAVASLQPPDQSTLAPMGVGLGVFNCCLSCRRHGDFSHVCRP